MKPKSVRSNRRKEHQPIPDQRTSKPVSCHPDVEEAAPKPLVTESDVIEFQREQRKRKPIVSVHGRDVKDEPWSDRKVA